MQVGKGRHIKIRDKIIFIYFVPFAFLFRFIQSKKIFFFLLLN
nr:MAG TPA: hypothetical protein [Caudoviricetes sp.]